MKTKIDLSGKCGSCWYFHQIKGTACGECRKFPYGENVAHDPMHPYFEPTRSRMKRKEYRTKPITNYDLLLRKTPEEMASFIFSCEACMVPLKVEFCPHMTDGMGCDECWLNWLKSPAEEGET